MSKKNGKLKALMQAHMSSVRLPNKVLMDICGKPDLLWNIERCSKAKYVDEVIVATSALACDDVIEMKCKEWGIKCYRGSDTDVLERFYGAAKENPSNAYYRVTSDCPLNDPQFLDNMAEFFFEQQTRYVGGNGKNPVGIGGEIFTYELLEEAENNATEPFEREHVTPYMYTKQNSVARYPYQPDHSFIRLTLDTPEDYDVIKRILQSVYSQEKDFSLKDIVAYLQAHPDILEINGGIQQKGLSESISYKDIFTLFGKN